MKFLRGDDVGLETLNGAWSGRWLGPRNPWRLIGYSLMAAGGHCRSTVNVGAFAQWLAVVEQAP